MGLGIFEKFLGGWVYGTLTRSRGWGVVTICYDLLGLSELGTEYAGRHTSYHMIDDMSLP